MQDPPEEYFSKQRQKLGCNDNPSLQEFGRTFIQLNVAGDDLIRVMSGNTRGQLREEARVDIENITLPPMKKRRKDPQNMLDLKIFDFLQSNFSSTIKAA